MRRVQLWLVWPPGDIKLYIIFICRMSVLTSLLQVVLARGSTVALPGPGVHAHHGDGQQDAGGRRAGPQRQDRAARPGQARPHRGEAGRAAGQAGGQVSYDWLRAGHMN